MGPGMELTVNPDRPPAFMRPLEMRPLSLWLAINPPEIFQFGDWLQVKEPSGRLRSSCGFG